MKVALCLHGRVGSMSGKTYSKDSDSNKALELSAQHTKVNLLDDNVDVFIHSWSLDSKEELLKNYLPKRYIIEKQKHFDIPNYIKADNERAFAHLSRWYSFYESVKLKSQYEEDNSFKYDLVLCQRFDICWDTKVDFTSFDSSKFYLGNSNLNPKVEWDDRWCITNSSDMDKFSSLYYKLEEYMGPDGELKSDKQYAGISSHFLICYHANKLGLEEKFKYTYQKDYDVTRQKYS